MWVPHFLQTEEIEHSHSVRLKNLAQIFQDPDFFSSVIIDVDKSWIHHYDPKIKCETEAWLCNGESRMKKIRQRKSAGKVMLVAFFSC